VRRASLRASTTSLDYPQFYTVLISRSISLTFLVGPLEISPSPLPPTPTHFGSLIDWSTVQTDQRDWMPMCNKVNFGRSVSTNSTVECSYQLYCNCT
jgi:hypothetical protein